MSASVTYDLQQLFAAPLRVAQVDELTLSGNQPVSRLAQRMRFRAAGAGLAAAPAGESASSGFVFAFGPLKIRTFRVVVLSS